MRSPGTLLMTFVLATSGSLTAQEPVIPSVPPRPANTLVMLPDGSTVHVELATTEKERNYGLMGRTRLPEGRGMLFVHEQPGHYAYWMYHCKIALDILWMNQDHQIVEMSARTPPCTGVANTCPGYGGKQASIYVLELPAGDIAKRRLNVGEVVNFQLPSANSDSASTQDQSAVPESGSSLTSRAHK